MDGSTYKGSHSQLKIFASLLKMGLYTMNKLAFKRTKFFFVKGSLILWGIDTLSGEVTLTT